MGKRHACWILLILISAGLLLPAGGCSRQGKWTGSEGSHEPVMPDGESWTFHGVDGLILESAHYRIYTTVQDAALLAKLPMFLEEAYQQYQAFLPPAEPDEEPFEVYLFARRYEWEAHTRENTGPMAEKYLEIRAGAYSHEGVCVAYLLERYSTFGVLAHEGFHQFSKRRLNHRIPAWMEEGLACNFEAHLWKAGHPYFTPNLDEFRIRALRRALLNDWLYPLPELLATNAGEAVGMPEETTATFYAQAWALTRFLQETSYQSAFRQMLDDAAAGVNLASPSQAEDIFRSYFRTDLEDVSDQFLVFAHKLANRDIRPGIQVIVLSPDTRKRTITITEEDVREITPEPPYETQETAPMSLTEPIEQQELQEPEPPEQEILPEPEPEMPVEGPEMEWPADIPAEGELDSEPAETIEDEGDIYLE